MEPILLCISSPDAPVRTTSTTQNDMGIVTNIPSEQPPDTGLTVEASSKGVAVS